MFDVRRVIGGIPSIRNKSRFGGADFGALRGNRERFPKRGSARRLGALARMIRSVHSQQPEGSPTDGGNADHPATLDLEVIRPLIVSGVEQPGHFGGIRIKARKEAAAARIQSSDLACGGRGGSGRYCAGYDAQAGCLSYKRWGGMPGGYGVSGGAQQPRGFGEFFEGA